MSFEDIQLASCYIQGHIWRTGFENNELEGVVFEDVPEALARWHGSGIKVISSFYFFSGVCLITSNIFNDHVNIGGHSGLYSFILISNNQKNDWSDFRGAFERAPHRHTHAHVQACANAHACTP